MGALSAVDRGQRRFPPVGYPLAVVYKFFDDQGNYLAAVLTYYTFVAVFPLMLLASSILGFVLQGRPELQKEVLDSALSQFPIIGDQLGQPDGLQGSTGAIIAGALAALYGCVGLGVAIQNVANAAWAVPRNSRPNPFLVRLKSLGLLGTAGLSVLVVSVLSAVVGNTEVFGSNLDATIAWLIRIATVLVVGLVLTFLFRMAAARSHAIRRAAPGGFAVAIMWQMLQYAGASYVTHVIARADASSMNKTFGLVLGLIGFIYIAAVMGVLGVEMNVVLARRLWPRALLTPFTDAVDLTEADRRAYALYAQTQRHKGFETVTVQFEGRDGARHEIVLAPKPKEEPPTSETAAPAEVAPTGVAEQGPGARPAGNGSAPTPAASPNGARPAATSQPSGDASPVVQPNPSERTRPLPATPRER